MHAKCITPYLVQSKSSTWVICYWFDKYSFSQHNELPLCARPCAWTAPASWPHRIHCLINRVHKSLAESKPLCPPCKCPRRSASCPQLCFVEELRILPFEQPSKFSYFYLQFSQSSLCGHLHMELLLSVYCLLLWVPTRWEPSIHLIHLFISAGQWSHALLCKDKEKIQPYCWIHTKKFPARNFSGEITLLPRLPLFSFFKGLPWASVFSLSFSNNHWFWPQFLHFFEGQIESPSLEGYDDGWRPCSLYVPNTLLGTESDSKKKKKRFHSCPYPGPAGNNKA